MTPSLFEGKSGMRYCPKASTSKSILRHQPRESKIVELVYFDAIQFIAKSPRNHVHRPLLYMAGCIWAILHAPSPRAYPITFTALVVLQSGSSGYTPSHSTPVLLRTHRSALTVCTIAGTSRCPASGTDTLTASKINGHSKSCLNT